ncbi:diguanylate cyclase (GGDEF)-like protein/PAS domain S-box-containing protein [Bradyrhizobium sp. AZCC 1578]
MAAGERSMTDHIPTTAPRSAHLSARLEDAINHMSLGIVVFDEKREVVFCNRRYREMYGLSPEQVKPGTPTQELIRHRLKLGLKVQVAVDDYIRERVGRDIALDTTVQEFTDGRIVAYTVYPMPDGGGMATHEDITEREALNARLKKQYELGKEQEEALRVRNFQFDTAINNMSQGLCFFDSDHRLIVCNDRFVEMYDIAPERVSPGMSLVEIVDLRFEAGSFPAMTRDEYLQWRTNVAVSNEAKDSIVELKNGRTFKIRHRPMPGGGWVATHEDITEQRQSEVKIEYMAHHDALTDLANRVLLNDRLEHALGRVSDGEMVAVHHLDLDQFKAVNDTFGHPCGDKLLRSVAERLRRLVGDSDTIARRGGDEFVIVQATISDPADATSLAQRVIDALSEPYEIDGQQAVIGVSIGISVGPGDGSNPDKLLRNADLALYRAKSDGRSTFRFFEPAMDLQMQTRRILEQDLRKALPAGEFELHYQPVVNLASKEISGFEALIRWNHPTKGMISPAAFIPLAEEIGFIVPMGEWVIRQACATAALWPDNLHVAVNISAIQFRSPGLMPVIVGALAASGLAPTRLEIEITESVLLHNKEATLALLHQLRALGIRIAMDDFGTGYSSLTYLQSFPFDKIKIDRSFVKNITENSSSLNIVRAVAALANGMGMTATAEGVETAEQLHSIASEGCTEMQGFLFSKPLPAAEIERQFLSGGGREGLKAASSRRDCTVRHSGAREARIRNDGVSPSKLRRDLRQHFEQRDAVGGTQQLVETRLVLAGNELFGARQHRPSLVRQNQDVRATVVGRAHPGAEAAALQRIQHRDEIRPEDAERVGDFGLVAPGIAIEQQ